MSFERSHELYVMEDLGPMCDGEIVRFTPTLKTDGGGAQYIRWGSPHPLGIFG